MTGAGWALIGLFLGLALGLTPLVFHRKRTAIAIQALLDEAALRNPLVDYNADILCIVSREGNWVFSNAASYRILGHAPAALTNKRVLDFVHPEDDDIFDETVPSEPLTSAAHARLVSLRMKHRLGHWIWIDAHVSRAPGKDPTVYWIVSARDVGQRKQAEMAQIQAHARLAQQASVDGLTGLFNRRHILAVMEKEAARAFRSGQPLCVLLIDIDHFKPLNDYYGHPHGDSCLVLVAECLMAAVLRPADVVGRYGGEEFMVLLPDTDARGMTIVAEKIRRSVEEMNQPHIASPFKRMTVSIGGVHIPADQRTPPEKYVRLADNALYRAKRLGRNRVVCASEGLRASGSEDVTLATH